MAGKFNDDDMDRIETSCITDYEEHSGKILLANLILGYKDDDYVEITCDPPVRVRVRMDMNYRDMLNWTDEDFCDPNWDVEIVEPHPSLENVSSMWVDGISRAISGKVERPSTWTVDENQEPPPPPPKPALKEPPRESTEISDHRIAFCCPHCGETISITTTFILDE